MLALSHRVDSEGDRAYYWVWRRLPRMQAARECASVFPIKAFSRVKAWKDAGA